MEHVTHPAADEGTTFDRYARMLRRHLSVPTALVTLVEPDRQVFCGLAGLPEPWATRRETTLSHSFCQYVVADSAPLVIADARLDERLQDNLAIVDLGVIAYAGWPLIDDDGVTIGSLCAIDVVPRTWSAEDLETLEDLAASCSAELAHRAREEVAEEQREIAEQMSHRSQVLLALSESLAVTRTLDDIAYAVESVAKAHLGALHAGMWLCRPGEGGEQERLTYISDPAASWSSAARNSLLPIDESNPLGETIVRRHPFYFTCRADQNARYPHLDLSQQVGEARVFLPLSLGRVFGALAMVWTQERTVSAEESVTIVTLASYVAQAIQRALLLEDRERASMTLQNHMLTTLPTARGMEITARYRPAAAQDRVGGDWYDAVVTPSGETNLMIGDVMGHDIEAAAVMGELRSMLRALAWTHDDSPAANVERLDAAMASFGMERFASLLFARVSAPDGTGKRGISWTNAGHFPPLLVHPDGSSDILDDGAEADLLLGVDAGPPRRNLSAQLPDGATLLLFTDGLVERRDASLDDGISAVRAVAAQNPGVSPDELLDVLLDDVVGNSHEDDIALLAIRFG